MTKGKFEVGKTYAAESSSAGTYVVVARTAKTVTLQEVKFQFRYGEYVRKDLDEVHRYKIREGWGICWKTEENRGWKQETVIVRHCAIRAFDDECALGEGYVNRQQIGEKDTSELDAEIDATVENLKEELETAKTELAEVEEEIEKGNDVEQNEALKKEYLDEIEDIKHNLEDWLGVGAGDDLEKAIELANCAGDYAVNVEAQEIAVNAEIENANNATKVAEISPSIEKIFAAVDENIKPAEKNPLKAKVAEINAIENILDEIDDGKYAIESIESRIEKITTEFNEVKDSAEPSKAKEIQFLIDCANEEIDFAKKRIADAMKEIDGKNINAAQAEVAGMLERIEYAEETFDRANSILAEVEEVNAEKNPLKEKILDLRAAEKIISEKYLSLCRSLYVKIDGEYQSAVGFDDYVTKYHDTFYCREGDDYVEDTAAYYELKEIEREWNALFKELEYFENIEEKAKILKAKIAEQKNSRKSVIDWKATFEDMKIFEILNLQKDLKKFLKLGQIDLAENIFSMLKTLCKNYRAVAA